MPPNLNNINDLLSYLDAMEKRIHALERENETLQSQKESLNQYIQALGGDAQKMLPKTSLLSTSFLQRAFAVWGHYFVAQLIISIPIICLYLILVFTILKSGLPEFPTN